MSWTKHPDAWKVRLYFLIGQRVRERREAMGMSIREFGAQLRVSETSVEKYESGEQPMPLSALYRATEVFDCTADELMPVMTDADVKVPA